MNDAQLDALLEQLPRYDASDDVVATALDRVAADVAAPPAPAPGPARDGVVPLRRRPWPALAVAVAAAAALLLWVRPPAPEVATGPSDLPGGLTIKGDADVPASVELGLSVLRDGVPVAMPAGARVQRSDTLLFRYSVDRDGFVYLFRDDGRAVEVFSGAAATAGTHHLEVGGEVQGYALGDLAGEQRFGVAWSAEPWPAGDAGPVPPIDLRAPGAAAVDVRAVVVLP